MALVVQDVARIRGYTEPNGSFATEGSIGSFYDVPAIEGTVKVTLNDPTETPGLIQQHIDGYPSKVRLPRTATADFALNLTGLNARATGLAVANTLTNLCEIAFGGVFLGTGMLTNGGSETGTTLIVAATTALREGGAVAIVNDGFLEMREIRNLSSTNISAKLDWSSGPDTGTQIYACATTYLGNVDGSTVQSLQLAVEGLDNNDRWLLRGGQVSTAPTFELTPGGIPRINFSWKFVDWDYADGVNTTMNLTSAALADQNYADTSIISIVDSELRMPTVGTSTLSDASLLHAPTVTIQPNITYTAHKTPAGVNTVKQWVRTRSAPVVTGDVVVPFEDQTYFTMFTSEDNKALFFQIGSTVTKGGVLISVPNIHLDNVQREGMDGIAGQRFSFVAGVDRATDNNSSIIERSPFRIHQF